MKIVLFSDKRPIIEGFRPLLYPKKKRPIIE
jgi:hypothetical protein